MMGFFRFFLKKGDLPNLKRPKVIPQRFLRPRQPRRQRWTPTRWMWMTAGGPGPFKVDEVPGVLWKTEVILKGLFTKHHPLIYP